MNISFLWLLLKLLIARGYSVGSHSAKLLSAPFLMSGPRNLPQLFEPLSFYAMLIYRL